MKSLMRLGCLILILANVNCSQSGQGLGASNSGMPTSLLSSETVSQGDGGNGTQYDGKIKPGKYVRQLTDKFCGSNIKNLGEIIVTETSATGRLIDPNTCTPVDVSLDLNSLEHADYQQGRIGFLEGIYSAQAKKGSQQLPGIDEVWCRKEGSTSATGFDIVIRADYQNRTYHALTASATAQADGSITEVSHDPFKISDRRFEDGDRVRYRASGFELEIRRRDYVQKTGLMRGELQFSRNGLNESISIYCRLGGQLDVMLPK